MLGTSSLLGLGGALPWTSLGNTPLTSHSHAEQREEVNPSLPPILFRRRRSDEDLLSFIHRANNEVFVQLKGRSDQVGLAASLGFTL